MDGPANAASTDTAYEALADPLRRETLCLLDRKDDQTITRETLVDSLATLYDPTREQIELGLNHTHLPKLAAAGFIEYDDRSGVIRYRESEFLSAHLDVDIIECKTCAKDEISTEEPLR